MFYEQKEDNVCISVHLYIKVSQLRGSCLAKFTEGKNRIKMKQWTIVNRGGAGALEYNYY